jgi:HEAT repeat protein
MSPSTRQTWQSTRAALLVLLAALAAPAGFARSQAPAADPVERLRRVLQTNTEAADRDRLTRECLEGLRSLSELRRALTLAEWRDRNPESTLGSVDLANRAKVAERLQQAFRQVFARHEATSAAVAVGMLADMANAARTAGDSAAYLRPFGADLADLVVSAPPKVQAPAARALGLIEPDISVALPALAHLLQAPDPALRCAASEGLYELLQNAALSATRDGPLQQTAESRQAAIQATCSILPVAGKGLADWHVEVRRRCIATVGAAAAALGRMIPEPASGVVIDGADLAARTRTEREVLRPLALALRDQGPPLAKSLRDGDPEVRLLAQKALDEVASARARWLRHGGSAAAADDPLLDGLMAAMPALGEAVTDADLRVRRAALDVLGVLGQAAAPAVPALARALRDPDRFVRWSAVRTLGAVGPSAARAAMPGLTLLLDDEDLDVRKAAAETLKQLNPSAAGNTGTTGAAPRSATRTAVPALVRSVRSNDPEMRVAAIQALRAMGAEMKPALPALREALGDADAHVRQAAAEALGALGPQAREATDDLRAAMNDAAPEVRQAAGEALLNILRQPTR